jgi:hypothetical protein
VFRGGVTLARTRNNCHEGPPEEAVHEADNG